MNGQNLKEAKEKLKREIKKGIKEAIEKYLKPHRCRKCGVNVVEKEGDMCSECLISKFCLDDPEQIDSEPAKEK